MEVSLRNEKEFEEGFRAYPGMLPLMTSSHLAGWEEARAHYAMLKEIDMARGGLLVKQ